MGLLMNNSKRSRFYSKVSSGKYEDRFPLKHIVNEKEKVVWVLCESVITAMGITAMMNKHYPGYEAKLVNRDSFNDLLKEQ